MQRRQTSPPRQALQIAATSKLGLTAGALTAEVASFTGPFNLSIRLTDPGDLTAGLARATDAAVRQQVHETGDAERTAKITEAFPPRAEPTACIVEMEGDAYFSRTRQRDPKPLFKKVLPTLNRNVQCLRPIPPATTKTAKTKAFPGTNFSTTDIERAAAALQDALRQAGYLPKLPTPPGVTGPFELITVWLAPAGPMVVPILIRQHTDHEATAQLIPTARTTAEPPMPLTHLPKALVAGRGRVSMRTSRVAVADFITTALALDATADRALLVRRARMSDKEIWPWLQDGRIAFDQLVLPGIDITNPAVTPDIRKPGDQPGLRIIRLRERTDRDAVPRAFGVAPETATPSDAGATTTAPQYGRFSGVVEVGERAFWGINPRAAQNQTPLGVTKLDPTDTAARTWTCSNPSSLEIVPAFLQDGDNPADWAMYVHALRRFHAHTEIATLWPATMHLAQLMEEYIL